MTQARAMWAAGGEEGERDASASDFPNNWGSAFAGCGEAEFHDAAEEDRGAAFGASQPRLRG